MSSNNEVIAGSCADHLQCNIRLPPPPPRVLTAKFQGQTTPSPRRQLAKILIVAGPAGTGKSTIAQKLAGFFNVPYIEGDDFHPPQNIRKMASGTPLDAADRALWLAQLWDEIRRRNFHAVVTCSALDLRTRTWLRSTAGEDRIGLHFAFLWASEATLVRRAQSRNGHYMKANMVHSQCAIMMVPGESESDDSTAISTDVGGPDKVFQTALSILLSRSELWK